MFRPVPTRLDGNKGHSYSRLGQIRSLEIVDGVEIKIKSIECLWNCPFDRLPVLNLEDQPRCILGKSYEQEQQDNGWRET